MHLERYALIGDTPPPRWSASTVRSIGCARLDAPACFAALLGGDDNGFWKLAPAGESVSVSRRYRGDTLVLETTWLTGSGSVLVTDCMPLGDDTTEVVRVVEGLSGEVDIAMRLVIRFDYGRSMPWVRRVNGTLQPACCSSRWSGSCPRTTPASSAPCRPSKGA